MKAATKVAAALFVVTGCGSPPSQVARVVATPIITFSPAPAPTPTLSPKPPINSPKPVKVQAKAEFLRIPPKPKTEAVWLGQQLAAKRGWTGEQWTALYLLWSYESGWRSVSPNGHGCGGIPQACPFGKIANAVEETVKLCLDDEACKQRARDWRHHPETQIVWGLNYIRDHPKYGTPIKALTHWHRRNWY